MVNKVNNTPHLNAAQLRISEANSCGGTPLAGCCLMEHLKISWMIFNPIYVYIEIYVYIHICIYKYMYTYIYILYINISKSKISESFNILQ